MKAVIVTQARMTSTRLPGKVLFPLGEGTVLDLHLRRLLQATLPIVVATTLNREDDPVVAAADALGAQVVRGSEFDVLSRFDRAVEESKADIVVRVTSDCPLIDGRLIAESVLRWRKLGDSNAYLSNTQRRTYPRGLDFEIFSAELLRRAHREATTPSDREHVTPYLYAGPSSIATSHHVERIDDGATQTRLTLDTEDDYQMLSTLVERIPDVVHMGADELSALLMREPDITGINASVRQKPL